MEKEEKEEDEIKKVWKRKGRKKDKDKDNKENNITFWIMQFDIKQTIKITNDSFYIPNRTTNNNKAIILTITINVLLKPTKCV